MVNTSTRVDPRLHGARRAVRVGWHRLSLLTLALLFPLSGCQDDIRKDEPSDSVLIRILFDSFAAKFQNGLVAKAEDLFTTSYLHQGFDRDNIALWLKTFIDREGLRVSFDQLTLDQKNDEATVDYFLEIKTCQSVADTPLPSDDAGMDEENAGTMDMREVCETVLRCRSEAGGRCGQWTHLKRIEGVWRFHGDQREVGTDLSLRATADGVFIAGQIIDPTRQLKGVKGRWKGTDEVVKFESLSGGAWTPMTGKVPDGFYPSSPLPWTLTLGLEGQSKTTQLDFDFVGFHDQFATNLLPSGEAVPPFEFRWTNAENAQGGARIEVRKDETILWRSPIVFSESVLYGGPNLPVGERVEIHLLSYDVYGNTALTVGSLKPVDDSVITPEPKTIEPATAAAAGGTAITIRGEGFLNGVSVLFGTTNALDVKRVDDSTLTCTTPPLMPGVYNVIVANPGNQVGMIENGYTALDTSVDSD